MWAVKNGSGRATCRICDCLIGKDERQVTFIRYWGAKTVNESVHLNCLNNYDKVRVFQVLNEGSKG